MGLFLIASYSKRDIPKQALWLVAPLGFFSLMVFVRASELLTFLNVIASFSLLFFIAQVLFGKDIKRYLLQDYFKTLLLPFKFFVPFTRIVLDLFASHGVVRHPHTFSQVIKGIGLTVPFLIIFLLLFSSADLIFQKHFSGLFDIGLNVETVFRSILVLVVTSIFVGAYSYVFRTAPAVLLEQQPCGAYTLGRIETSILLGSVGALFALFILIQITYLFGGEGAFLSQGFTYAEYARRGFFELIIVAVISLFLLWMTEKYVVKEDAGHTFLFKALSSVLIVEVILIMTSAFLRLSLYEGAYGFTTLRVYSHIFIIWLAVVFLFLLYKVFRDKRETAFAFRVFISVIGFVVAMNVFNPDAFIARHNIELFILKGKLDFAHLSQLSDDAVPAIAELLNSSNKDLREFAAYDLRLRSEFLKSPSSSSWQSANIGHLRIKLISDSKLKGLEQE